MAANPPRRVIDLHPGDIVDSAGMSVLYVADAPHPLYEGLRLVIWRLDPKSHDTRDWSHDALSAYQVVGVLRDPHLLREKNEANLRWALRNEGKCPL